MTLTSSSRGTLNARAFVRTVVSSIAGVSLQELRRSSSPDLIEETQTPDERQEKMKKNTERYQLSEIEVDAVALPNRSREISDGSLEG